MSYNYNISDGQELNFYVTTEAHLKDIGAQLEEGSFVYLTDIKAQATIVKKGDSVVAGISYNVIEDGEALRKNKTFPRWNEAAQQLEWDDGEDLHRITIIEDEYKSGYVYDLSDENTSADDYVDYQIVGNDIENASSPIHKILLPEIKTAPADRIPGVLYAVKNNSGNPAAPYDYYTWDDTKAHLRLLVGDVKPWLFDNQENSLGVAISKGSMTTDTDMSFYIAENGAPTKKVFEFYKDSKTGCLIFPDGRKFTISHNGDNFVASSSDMNCTYIYSDFHELLHSRLDNFISNHNLYIEDTMKGSCAISYCYGPSGGNKSVYAIKLSNSGEDTYALTLYDCFIEGNGNSSIQPAGQNISICSSDISLRTLYEMKAADGYDMVKITGTNSESNIVTVDDRASNKPSLISDIQLIKTKFNSTIGTMIKNKITGNVKQVQSLTIFIA